MAIYKAGRKRPQNPDTSEADIEFRLMVFGEDYTEPEQSPKKKPAPEPQPEQGDDEPHPLPPELLPVPAFDCELLPTPFQAYVRDHARLLDCAPELIAVPIICALGSVLGNKIGIRPKQHGEWVVHPNVWGAIIGRSSAMKSPACKSGIAPIKHLQKLADKERKKNAKEDAKKKFIADIERKKAEDDAKKAVKNGEEANLDFFDEEDEALAARSFSINNSTLEALHEHLSKAPNDHGVLVDQDELTALVAKMNHPQTGDELRAFYLSGYSGSEGHRMKRVGRGEINVERVCLSVFGGIQPAKIAPVVTDAVKGTGKDDGFIQRFGLMVYPDMKPEWKCNDFPVDKSSQKEVNRLFEYAESIDAGTTLHFEEDARTAFAGWLEKWTAMRREGHFALDSHFGKYNSLVPQLALIIHICEADEPEEQRVSMASLQKALAWVKFLAEHAKRVYDGGNHNTVAVANHILDRIRAGNVKLDEDGSFVARIIYRVEGKFKDKEAVQSALELLADNDWLYAEEFGKTKKSVKYFPHPSIVAQE